MSTPPVTFEELTQIGEAMTTLVGEARGLAAGAQQLPARIADITALVQRALKQIDAVTSHAAAAAGRAKRESELAIAQHQAAEAAAKVALGKQQELLVTVAGELRRATADRSEVLGEISSLREQARAAAKRDAEQARSDLEAELADVVADLREATAERDAMHASIESMREKARAFVG